MDFKHFFAYNSPAFRWLKKVELPCDETDPHFMNIIFHKSDFISNYLESPWFIEVFIVFNTLSDIGVATFVYFTL